MAGEQTPRTRALRLLITDYRHARHVWSEYGSPYNRAKMILVCGWPEEVEPFLKSVKSVWLAGWLAGWGVIHPEIDWVVE